MEQNKEMSLGREITKEVVGDACGLGAGVLVGGIAMAAVEAIPGVGKGLKLLLKMGAFGLEVATMYQVTDAVKGYIDDLFGTVDLVKGIFGGKKPEDGTVEAEVAVK